MNEAGIRHALSEQWSNSSGRMDWLGLESLLVQILKSELSESEQIAAVREAIDAYTKRGHFLQFAGCGSYLSDSNAQRGAVSLPLAAAQAAIALGLASGVASLMAWAQGLIGGVL